MDDKSWNKLAQMYIKAGKMPFPVTDTVVNVLKFILTEKQAEFLLLLKKSSYNIEEIKPLTNMDPKSLNKMLNELMHIGALTGLAGRHSGLMVYRLPPFFPGLLEFTLMRGEFNDKTKELAKLWDKFFYELVDLTQKNYDRMIPLMKEIPPIDRIVPVEEFVEPRQEVVLPYEEVSKIIEHYEPIALMTCYCRHRNDLLGHSCKKTKVRKNCIGLGRPAEFLIAQGFAQKITKEEALKVLKQCSDDGLVHKAFHANLDYRKEIDGICNCCEDCCGTFLTHYAGAMPLMSQTHYIAKVVQENCVGCGTCVEQCNAKAIELVDIIATINEARCLGCGLCAHLCPEKAILLKRTEQPRHVFVPPPKLKE